MESILYEQIYQIEKVHWWYRGRRKIIFHWAKKILASYQNPRVLDVGCGTGYNIELLQSLGVRNVYGLDYSADALRFCGLRRLRVILHADAMHIPATSQAFDLVMALDILEHLCDDDMALAEFYRVLRPGGTIIIFVPALRSLWGLQDEISHHFRRYTATQLRTKVLRTGLQIQKLTYANMLLFPIVALGRYILRFWRFHAVSENDLSPRCMNSLLAWIFGCERTLLQVLDFPIGVSLMCIAKKS